MMNNLNLKKIHNANNSKRYKSKREREQGSRKRDYIKTYAKSSLTKAGKVSATAVHTETLPSTANVPC